MKRVLTGIEWGFHTLMLALIVGALLLLWREVSGNPIDPYEGDTLIRFLLLLGYAVVLVLLLREPAFLWRGLIKGGPIWLLLLWAFLSLVWSTAPEVTFRKAIAALLTSLYGVYLAFRFTPEAFLRLLGTTLLLLLGLSIAFVFLLPDWGLMGYPHEGAWRGIFVHKNDLGRFAALGVLVFLALLLAPGRKRVWLVGLFLSGVVLAGARSATSLVLAFAMLLVVSGLWIGQRYRRLWPVLLLLGVLLGASGSMVLAANYEVLLEALGKDVTLTGRIPLWLTLIPFIQERLWVGYGFGGFWLGWEGPSAYVWSLVGWGPVHGHNGYLDLWLDLGLVGLLLGLWLLLRLILASVQRYVAEGFSSRALFQVGVVTFLIIYNFAESSFLRANNLYWLFLVWSYLRVGAANYSGINAHRFQGARGQ
ncbi:MULTISPECIES: O-antigen ligase family protein [Thermus]|uniref:O-antigen ligase family protein n=1 Tax=Thermus brockianus TaxID=56956 RepID=UPI001F17A82F|nr:O-antigen ligase family protein [Thermus brockianus]